MSPRLDAGTRLYALIGEAIHNLPPRLRAAACRDDSCAAADAWRCDVRLADRKLRGLGAVLQTLQKAQANTCDAAADVPPGDTLVDELLLLGRERVDTARDALRGAA